MKTALITGLTGQDGTYLAELLLSKGYRVVGAVRNTKFSKASMGRALEGVEFTEWDMLSQSHMTAVLRNYRPSEIYNFAAYSSGAGMYDDPVSMGEVNGLAVARILESIREVDIGIRFCQASSREIFGDANESPQTEATARSPRSPYGAAKLYADSMIQIYRSHHKLYACSAILFNHESPRRGLGFVVRKITHEAARVKLGLTTEVQLGNLNARRDWGYAADYVLAMWLMLQQDHADDFVIATGVTHSVREVCEIAFNHLGLDYRNFVRETAADFRPSEYAELVGCAAKAKHRLGWYPEVGFDELVKMMVGADVQHLSENIIKS